MVCKFPRKLKEPQKLAIPFIARNKHVLLAYGTGSGKSIIALSTSQLLLSKSLVDVSIILAPAKGIIPVEQECIDCNVPYQRVTKKEDKNISRLQHYSGVIIATYGEIEKVINYVVKYSKGFSVFFDEAHKLKNPKTRITKRCKILQKKALYSIGMTGTPITRDISDFYYLVSFFNPNILGNYVSFLDKYTVYFTMSLQTKAGFEYKHYKPTKFKNLDSLRKVCCNTLLTYYPDYNITYDTKFVPLVNREEYRNISQSMLEGGEEHAPEKLILLQHYLNKQSPKITMLLSIVQKYISEGLIIYTNNYEELTILEKLFASLKYSYKSYTGKINEKNAKSIASWFTENPKNKVLFITLAGGQSINLQCVQRLIFYSLPFSIGEFLQIIGRISRENSKFTEFLIYLILTQGTIETYKNTYLQMFSEVYKVLLGNNALAKTTNIPSMNRYLLKEIAKETVWN